MSDHPYLPAEVLQQVFRHAVGALPNECCGVIYGGDRRDAAAAGWRVQPARNIQDELHAADPAQFPRRATTGYHLDAESLFALARSLSGPAPARLVYHSHVEVGAYFSAADQAAAHADGQPIYPVEHLVIDVGADGARGAVQFAWDPVVAAYVEVHRY